MINRLHKLPYIILMYPCINLGCGPGFAPSICQIPENLSIYHKMLWYSRGKLWWLYRSLPFILSLCHVQEWINKLRKKRYQFWVCEHTNTCMSIIRTRQLICDWISRDVKASWMEGGRCRSSELVWLIPTSCSGSPQKSTWGHNK